MHTNIYLLNLPDSVDRHRQAHCQLDLLAWQADVVSSVDGRGVNPNSFAQYDDRAAKRKFGRSLLGAEVACFLSHRKALEVFLTSRSKSALILEDDFTTFRASSIDIDGLAGSLSSIEPNWHIFNIGYPAKRHFTLIAHELADLQICRTHHFPTTATAILWSRVGAERFLGEVNRVEMPYDHALRAWNSRHDQGFGLLEPIFTNSGAASDIALPPNLRQSFWPKRARVWVDRFYAMKNQAQYRARNGNMSACAARQTS